VHRLIICLPLKHCCRSLTCWSTDRYARPAIALYTKNGIAVFCTKWGVWCAVHCCLFGRLTRRLLYWMLTPHWFLFQAIQQAYKRVRLQCTFIRRAFAGWTAAQCCY
jgi:hypothetical protein